MPTTKELWQQAAVLNAAEGVGRPPVEPHPADDGYAPPVTSVKLPSRGLVYPPESPLYHVESVDIKAVSANEENILASATLIKSGRVLTTLMKACITNRMLDPEEMLIGDRNAILTAIRVSAYGPGYNARVICPECGEDAEHTFDVSRLNLKTLDVMPVNGPGSNEFEFKLPTSGRLVRFKLMDAATSTRLERDVAEVKKKTGSEQGVTMLLTAVVTQLQGVNDPKQLPKALRDLPARDARALRVYMDEIAPGVDMEQEYECSSCGSKTEVAIPIGTGFFWPSGPDRSDPEQAVQRAE
jgi:hypothetical protein